MNNFRKELAKRTLEFNRIYDNSEYGDFIIQTNKVQYLIIFIILIRLYQPSKKNLIELEGLTFGLLIKCFRICAKSKLELSILRSLSIYKKSRDALAHKMFTEEALTTRECKLTIELGNEIVIFLEELKNKEIKKLEEIIKKHKSKTERKK